MEALCASEGPGIRECQLHATPCNDAAAQLLWLGGSSSGSQGLLKHHQLQTQQLSFFQPRWV